MVSSIATRENRASKLSCEGDGGGGGAAYVRTRRGLDRVVADALFIARNPEG